MAKKKSNARAIEIGAGITAAMVAAAAGAYLLSDKKNKTKAKAWVGRARAHVAKRAKAAKRLSKAEYDRLVDRTVKQYGSIENMTAGDIIAAAKAMKAEWNNIQAHAKKMAHGGKTAPAKKRSIKKRKPTSKAKTKAKTSAKKRKGRG